jgi:hypothetical protein
MSIDSGSSSGWSNSAMPEEHTNWNSLT